MKNWRVSDIRWASESELKLPFWQKWNQNNRLPKGFWQKIWELPYLASRVPSSGLSIDVGGIYPFVLLKNFPQATSAIMRSLNEIDPLYYLENGQQKLMIADATNIPVSDNSYDYAFSISAIEKMPHTFAVLHEMLRIARYRIVITMNVSDKLGIPINRLREMESFLKTPIPQMPINSLTSTSQCLMKYNQTSLNDKDDIRILAFTIDSCDTPKSTAILIPHWNSWDFLTRCVKNIKQNANPLLQEKIYILDDESTDGSFEKILNRYGNDETIVVQQIRRSNKKTEADVGLLIDEGLKLVQEQFVAMIDADVFPLSKEWLSFPIWLLEKYNCSSVGLDTGLSTAYAKFNRNKWRQPKNGYLPRAGLYDNEWFSCTNNLYRIMNTALAKVVSQNIGFTRASSMVYGSHNSIVGKIAGRIYRKVANSYVLAPVFNRRYPYLPGGEDNGVAANHFMDLNHMGPKFNIPLTSSIGLTPQDGAFGQNISGLVFHFALSTRALSQERREVKHAGEKFDYWVSKIKMEGFNDSLLEEMIKESSQFQAGGYDHSIPAEWYVKEYEYIQQLLEEYRNEYNT